MRDHFPSIVAVAVLALCGCTRPQAASAPAGDTPDRRIIARVFNSQFPQAIHAYNGITAASDGRIYYVLSSNSIDTGGQMYSYDPRTDKIEHVGDLTEAAGEKGSKSIPQGKSHVSFVEAAGKLYFATHVAYYTVRGGRELMGVPPSGYKPYPGGHFLAYDLASRRFEDLARGPAEQGILAMAMDTARGRLCGLTWPNGYFLRYDLASKDLKNLGPVSREGEAGSGPTYRALCRSLVVNPEDGSVYLTTSEGATLRYRYDRDAIEPVEGEDLRKDYFGIYDPNLPGHMGYNWRQALWHAASGAIYAVHGNSGYLFKFDPKIRQVDVLDRITSEPSRRSGMFDKFYYGYLGFTAGPDGRTLYYLTGGPLIVNGRRVVARNMNQLGAKGDENLHLVTYDIPAAKCTDHGAIFFPDGGKPSYVNSIAVSRDGSVYALGLVTEGGQSRTDLMRIPAVIPPAAGRPAGSGKP